MFRDGDLIIAWFRDGDPVIACSRGASGAAILVYFPHHIIKAMMGQAVLIGSLPQTEISSH